MKILEQGVTLPHSSLWKLQANIFSKLGLEAWTKKGVPSYMTSNPFTAKKYAHLVLGFLRDSLTTNSKHPIDPSEPIYIFDLGAGTGRFAYVFLKHFQRLIKDIHLFEQLTIRYVLTDIVESNLEFCKIHNYLKPYFEQGILDIAYYKHDQKEPIHLQLSNQVLTKEKLVNPAILIGNYFFDTIPQDLFRFNHGVWEEGLVTVKAPDNAGSDFYDDPFILEKLQVEFTYQPINNQKKVNYTEMPAAHSIIDEYSAKLDGIPFTIPIGALQCLHYFEQLTEGRMLVISGDQGYSTMEQLKHSGEPRLAIHGSFSMAVNYNAIARFFDKRNGKGFLTNHSDPLFQVFVGILGGTAKDYPELAMAHREHIEAFEPKDYWNLTTLVQTEWPNPSLETILIILKLGAWDPMNFYTFYSMIREQLHTATAKQKEDLRDAIHEVWENFYPIHPLEGEFIMNLGVLFFEMQRYAEALGFLQRSLMITGDNATTYTNMAACYLALFNPEAAHRCFEKAKALHEIAAANSGAQK